MKKKKIIMWAIYEVQMYRIGETSDSVVDVANPHIAHIIMTEDVKKKRKFICRQTVGFSGYP